MQRGTRVPWVMFLASTQQQRPLSQECMSWHDVTTGGRSHDLAVLSEKQRGKELSSPMQRMAAGPPVPLPVPPLNLRLTEVSELKLASRRHQMLKHLTLKPSPPPAMPGWVSSALTQPRQPAFSKLQEYCSTCQELNLKDALEN